MHNRDLARTLRDTLKWGVALMLVFAPCAMGGVRIWGYIPLNALGIILFLLGLIRYFGTYAARIPITGNRESFWKKTFHPGTRSPFLLVGILIIIAGILQIVPLPGDFVTFLSPSINELHPGYMAEVPGEKDLGGMAERPFARGHWHTFSIYPYRTKLFLFSLIGLFGVHSVVRLHMSGHRVRNYILNLIVIIGTILAGNGILQRITGFLDIFWWLPIERTADTVSPFVNRNHFAGYLVMCIPVALGMALSRRRKSEQSARWYIISMLVMSAALLMTMSRGGILSFVVSTMFFIIIAILGKRMRGNAFRWIAFGLAGIVLFSVVVENDLFPRIQELINIEKSKSFESRMDCWLGAARIFSRFPLLGVGYDNFVYMFPRYKHSDAQVIFTHAENDYLQIISETGLIGIGIVGLLLIIFVKQVKQAIQRFLDGETSILRIAAAAGCVGYLLHSFVDFHFYIPANVFLFITLLGILSAPYTFGRHVREYWKMPSPAALRWLSIVCILGAVLLYQLVVPVRGFRHELQYQAWNRHMTLNMKHELLREENFLKAEKELQDAEYLEPENALWPTNLALLYEKHSGTLGQKGIIVLSRGQELLLGKALSAMRRSISLHPVRWQSHVTVAELGAQLQERSWVSKAFEQAIYLNPTNAWIYISYGQYLFDDMQIEQSMHMYCKAIELYPFFIHDFLVRYTTKIADLDTLLLAVPHTWEMLWPTAIQLEKTERMYDSTVVKLLALKNNFSNEAMIAAADRKLERKDITNAAVLYTKSLNMYGSNEPAIKGLLQCYTASEPQRIIPLMKEYRNLSSCQGAVTAEVKKEILDIIFPVKDGIPELNEIYGFLQSGDEYSGNEWESEDKFSSAGLRNAITASHQLTCFQSAVEVELQIFAKGDKHLVSCRVSGTELEKGNDFMRNPFLKLTDYQGDQIAMFPVFYGSLGSAGIRRCPLEKYFMVDEIPVGAKFYFGFEYYTDLTPGAQSGGPCEELIHQF